LALFGKIANRDDKQIGFLQGSLGVSHELM